MLYLTNIRWKIKWGVFIKERRRTMTVFGYVRKDYPSETSIQMKKLMELECEDFFIEKTPFNIDTELKAMLKSLKENDILIIASLASFGKGINDLKIIIDDIQRKKIRLVCLEEEIDTSKKYSFIEILNMINSLDKEVRSEKVKQALVDVKNSGKQLGRPTIDEETVQQIKKLHTEYRLSLRDIASQCGVSIGTVHKYVH